MRADVLVTHRLPAGGDDLLDPEWQVWPGKGVMPRSELLDRVRTVEGLLCMLVDGIDEDLFASAPRLRVVSQMSVGVDNIDLGAASRRGIPVGHTPGVLTETTADSAFALVAAASRRLPEGQEALRKGRVGEWDPEFLMGGDLHATTLGIVGFGRIGQAIGRRGRGFGMDILYSGPHPKPEAAEMDARHVSFEDVMSRSDHVVVAAPLTTETYHLVDGAALGLLRDGVTFVNIARGGLVDHDALVAEASTGRIRVALDVTEPEPLPSGHPLLAMPNVLVVPHLASASVRTRRAMAEMAVDNLRRGLAGQALAAQANGVSVAHS